MQMTVELSDTVSGKTAPELKVDDIVLSTSKIFEDEYVGKYPQRIYDGAKWLKMSPDFVWGCWSIMEGLYKRTGMSLDKPSKDAHVLSKLWSCHSGRGTKISGNDA